MKLLTAAFIVAMTGPVLADHNGVPYKPASAVLVPPPQFNNQMGARYRGKFSRVLTTHAEVQRLCNNARALACAKFPAGTPAGVQATRCTVYMPNNLPPDLYKAVNTHEVGHCMGYRHNVSADGVAMLEALLMMDDGTLVWMEVHAINEDEEHDH